MNFLSDFSSFFDAALSRSIEETANGRSINFERFAVLNEVFVEVSVLTGTQPELKLFPSFATGSVSLKADSLELNREQLSQLKKVLEKCTTFDIIPLTTGALSISATVSGVFN